MQLNIATAALNQTPLDWKGNRQRIIDAVSKAHGEGAQITLLPELCITGYGCEDRFLRDDVLEKSWESLLKLTPQIKGVAAVGLPCRWHSKTYNCVAVIQDGKIIGLNAKRILAKDGVHYEPRWFAPWENGRQDVFVKDGLSLPFGDLVYAFGGVKVGIEICEEAWVTPSYPMRSPVDLVLNPSASAFEMGKENTRRSVVERQSKFHEAHYAYTNLVGLEAGRIIYDGSMLIADRGRLISSRERRFGFKDIYVMHTAVDISPVESKSSLYISGQKLTESKTASTNKVSEVDSAYQEFLDAEAIGLYDYLRKAKSRGFVVSLSGGRDSSTTVILVHHMIEAANLELGTDKLDPSVLKCIYQSTDHSSPETLEASRALCKELNIKLYEANIQPLIDHCLDFAKNSMKVELDWKNKVHDTSWQNLQARSRVQLPWLIANLEHRIFLVTSNRSELATGYTTMDGDTAGAFAPIAGISKDFINGFLKALQAGQLRGIRPVAALDQVIAIPATAELKPKEFKQQDEKDLMPFPVLARIEELYVRDRKSCEDIVSILQKEFPKEPIAEQVTKFLRLWNQSQWKRERAAPAFHLAAHSLDPKSWCRQPILVHGESDT